MRVRLLAVALLTVAVGGCGSSDEDQVRDTVSSYLNAFADGDGDKACDQLTGEAKRGLVDAVRAQVPELNATSCPQAIKALTDNLGADEVGALRDVKIARVTTAGDRATAHPQGATADAQLRKTDAGWLIDGGLGF